VSENYEDMKKTTDNQGHHVTPILVGLGLIGEGSRLDIPPPLSFLLKKKRANINKWKDGCG